jgi:DNA topoisomerase IA
VDAQKARQVLDRLVGFEISPLLTKRLGTIQEKRVYLLEGVKLPRYDLYMI